MTFWFTILISSPKNITGIFIENALKLFVKNCYLYTLQLSSLNPGMILFSIQTFYVLCLTVFNIIHMGYAFVNVKIIAIYLTFSF